VRAHAHANTHTLDSGKYEKITVSNDGFVQGKGAGA